MLDALGIDDQHHRLDPSLTKRHDEDNQLDMGYAIVLLGKIWRS
jgi:hypothetical protein